MVHAYTPVYTERWICTTATCLLGSGYILNPTIVSLLLYHSIYYLVFLHTKLFPTIILYNSMLLSLHIVYTVQVMHIQ